MFELGFESEGAAFGTGAREEALLEALAEVLATVWDGVDGVGLDGFSSTVFELGFESEGAAFRAGAGEEALLEVFAEVLATVRDGVDGVGLGGFSSTVFELGVEGEGAAFGAGAGEEALLEVFAEVLATVWDGVDGVGLDGFSSTVFELGVEGEGAAFGAGAGEEALLEALAEVLATVLDGVDGVGLDGFSRTVCNRVAELAVASVSISFRAAFFVVSAYAVAVVWFSSRIGVFAVVSGGLADRANRRFPHDLRGVSTRTGEDTRNRSDRASALASRVGNFGAASFSADESLGALAGVVAHRPVCTDKTMGFRLRALRSLRAAGLSRVARSQCQRF